MLLAYDIFFSLQLKQYTVDSQYIYIFISCIWGDCSVTMKEVFANATSDFVKQIIGIAEQTTTLSTIINIQ